MASHRCYQNVTFSEISPIKLKARNTLLRPLSLGYRRSSTVKQSLCPARAVHIKRRVLCSSFLEKNETRSEQDSEGRNWKLLLWSTLDVTATLGSVGGAVAFILTQEAMLIGLPLVLPLLALYASRRRESLKLQTGLREIRESWGLMTQQLDKHEEVKVQELQQAFKLWREDLQKQLPSGKLKSIESKLAALEGSVLSAGRSAQSAARNVEAASNNMAETTAAQMKELGTRLVKELQQDLQAKSQAPTEELTNLASRLEGIESSLQGLEEGQVQGMRRLAQSIMGAVEEAEASLQSTMQADARRSFDALQRLPALLAAALPVTDVTPLLADRTQPAAPAQIAPADRAWLQGVVENALQLATERVLEKQQDRAALPAVLADEQWDALGKRLRGIEQSVQDLLEGSGGEDVPAREEALVTEVAALRDDVSSALKGIRESDGVSPELAPLLSSINGSLEALRRQVETPLSAAEAAGAQNGALSGALLPIKAALAELQSSQASLQLALQSTSETSPSTVASAGVSVEEAARRAAKEVLREFSAQTPDVAELRETISATLAAVRQLEAATMERIASLAATINTLPSDSSPLGGMQKSLPESSASQAGADAPPKGYKGDPSDTREDAYARMQALLNAGKKASAEVAPAQPGTPSTPQMDSSKSFEDLVPISAWLGESPGADESRPERELASSYAETSSNGAASYPSPSQPAPETTSIYSTSEKVSQNQSGPSTSSSTPEQAPGKQPEFAAGPFQDDERGEQLGSFGDDRGSRNQQFSGNDVSMPGPTDADRDAPAAATPSVSNGSTAEAGGGEEELEALVAEGKQLLREGRQLTKAGYDLGAADLALQDAMACFEEAAQIDSASIKVQGNWGNALMAYGVLKKRYLSELRDAPPPRSYEERAAARAAEEQLTDEAEAALVAAGQRFLAVVERDQDDTRALANWGRALCLRAELARDPEVACALYEAAVAKFEAVLEADPSNRAVLRNCAFALFDLARLQPDPTSRASRQLLEDAARYLEDVLTINGSDEDAAIALDQCIAELDQGRAVRR